MSREVFQKLSEDRRNIIINSGISEFSKKSYSEANTDIITRSCGISKGILFYYFGSKKEFYVYCLIQALERLIIELPEPEVNDFYEMIFYFMEEKFSVCRNFSEEIRMINMAARETNNQVFEQKNKVLVEYMMKTKEKSARIIAKAVATLNLKESNSQQVTGAITLYIGAIINQYLEVYKEMPNQLFEQSEQIKAKIRLYLDYLLYGVVKEEV